MEKERPRVLDPIDRVSEMLFGLIMVLTVTGSLSVAEAGRADVREMLHGALGCNLAWGIVDGILYLLTSVLARGRNLAMLRAVRTTASPEAAREIIASALPPLVASSLQPDEYDRLRERLSAVPAPERPSFTRDDFRGALGLFLLTFLSTFPVALPFVFMSEARLALHVSNAIGVLMLFLGGWAVGRYAGLRPARTALAMAGLGGVLVAITKALGG
jgi:VIT1/CCC1 family predicted Fe2+/Mn2+ transporter